MLSIYYVHHYTHTPDIKMLVAVIYRMKTPPRRVKNVAINQRLFVRKFAEAIHSVCTVVLGLRLAHPPKYEKKEISSCIGGHQDSPIGFLTVDRGGKNDAKTHSKNLYTLLSRSKKFCSSVMF